MSSRFASRLVAVVRHAMAAAVVAAPVVLMSPWLGAECPDEVPHESVCPQPATIIFCSAILQQSTCDNAHGGAKHIGKWTCRSQLHSNKQCLDGTQQTVCWEEWDCEWVDTPVQECAPDVLTRIQHFATLKIEIPC